MVDDDIPRFKRTLEEKSLEPTLLVIDHYGWGAPFEKECRSLTGHIVVIDDKANRPHDCDVLVDGAAGRQDEDYRKTVPIDTTLMTGPDYAIIRPQFARKRDMTLKRRQKEVGVAQVLVSFGAMDRHRLIPRTIRALGMVAPNATIHVIVGAKANVFDEIRTLANLNKRVVVHADTDCPAEIMSRSDLAIGAAGVTALERCCMGLPALVVVTSDNQVASARGLEAAGAAVVVGNATAISDALLGHAIADLIGDDVTRRRLSTNAAGLCDGLGVDRVADQINELSR